VWRCAKLHELKTDKLMVRVEAMKKLATGILKGFFDDKEDFQVHLPHVPCLKDSIGE